MGIYMNGTGNYVLMLVYVDEEWMDIGGNEYPPEGYIEAKNFTEDIDIENGLYGIMWGKTCHFPYEKLKNGNWVVVKTEVSQDVIKVDGYYNRYKFRCGTVVHTGDIKSASGYIIDNKDNQHEGMTEDGAWLQPNEVAGSKEWIEEHGLSQRF
jgi:hypothetical protein